MSSAGVYIDNKCMVASLFLKVSDEDFDKKVKNIYLRAGIELKGASPAEKLKEVQALMAEGDERAVKVYESIGVYLAHTMALYAMFYNIRHVQMMGRVMSGKGGDIILETASRVMDEEYPELSFRPEAPDEKTRRVGQSAAAATLPEIK